MRLENSRFSGANGTELPYTICAPETMPCMVLQITHGMTEHFGRYFSLAEELTTYGIVVAGFDLRGHGENPSIYDTATLGASGWEETLKDMHCFRQVLKERFPGLPQYMMGFSMGSFLLRDYLNRYAAPDGAILMGTGTQPAFLLSFLLKVVDDEIRKYGFNRTTHLVQKLSFDTYNRKFIPNRTKFDWFCSDSNQLDLYLNDRSCRRAISAGLFYQLLDSMKRNGRADAYANWDKSMPVLLISGMDDPVGNMGKGVKATLRQMEKAGFRNVHMKLYPNVRHDVLHEEITGTARAVRDDLFTWLIKNNERSDST